MSLFDRSLLAIYSLVITILLLVSIPVIYGYWPEPLKLLLKAGHTPEISPILWTVIGLLIIIGLRLFFISLHAKSEKRAKAVVHDYKLGQVHITLPAIESLVKKAAYKVDGVKEVKPEIMPAPEGVSIVIKATITPDISIPETSKQLQQQVKDYIFQITGISTQNVKVMIENIATNKPRVE
ncbi:alkaline shock response membrane anchor protein AmaP [Peptococcaceae bacterium 1198_IL3148]